MKLFIFNDEKSYGILCRRSRRKIALQGLYLKNKNFLEFFGIFGLFDIPLGHPSLVARPNSSFNLIEGEIFTIHVSIVTLLIFF